MVEKIPSRRKGFSADIRMSPMFVPSLVLCPLIFVRSVFRSFFHNRKADAATSPDTSASSDKKSKLPKNAQNLGVIFWRDMMKKMLFHSYRKNNPGKLHTVNVMGP